MKKLVTTSLIAALLFSPIYANAAETSAADSIRFTVGSKTALIGDSAITLPVASYIDHGYAMVPLRVLAAGLHADLRYDVKTKEITITKDARSIRMRLSGEHALANGQTIKLPVRPVTHHNLAFGPVRAIASALNTKISWNSLAGTVTLSEKDGTPPHRQVRVQSAFMNDAEGWTGGFADLPVDYDPDIYELGHRFAAVPDQKKALNGLLLKGMNRSDDLFMYVTKKIGAADGLEANAKYKVRLKFDLATNQAGGGIGIGGAPAESVFVKAGVLNFEPKAEKVKESEGYYYRMNLDKGNQANDGKDMTLLGNIVKPDADKAGYQLKPFEHEFTMRTNGQGEAYIILGTDSGFEGLTSVYFTNVIAAFTPAAD